MWRPLEISFFQMPFVIVLLTFVALVVLWQASRQQRKAGLPGGRVVYTDTRGWGRVEKPLYDFGLDLTGKPDYLVEHRDMLIPVEVKTGRTPAAPYDSHIFQLAAYCMLVQRTSGKRPEYGIIKYPKRSFSVDYTPKLESAFLDLLAEIRIFERKRSADRSHQSPARCEGCGFRKVCDQRLQL